MTVPENTNKVLDLASGNGILAMEVQKVVPEAEIHLLDDSFLAIESSKLNVKGDSVLFHYDNDLNKINNNQFDYVISNPPFHVEHEIDINLPVELFKQVHRCLSSNGSFQLVANNHLNYKTHLVKIFSKVEITAQNDKFVVYTCSK
jgi:23S rRNA (guanine1835-N2)-methyltransferase